MGSDRQTDMLCEMVPFEGPYSEPTIVIVTIELGHQLSVSTDHSQVESHIIT